MKTDPYGQFAEKPKRKKKRGCCVFVLLIVIAGVGARKWLVPRVQELAADLPFAASQAEPTETAKTTEHTKETTKPVFKASSEKADAQSDKDLAEALYRTAIRGETQLEYDSALLGCDTAEQLMAVVHASFDAMAAAHKEVFPFNGTSVHVTWDGETGIPLGNVQIDLMVSEPFRDKPLESMMQEMCGAADQILAEAPADGSDYDKALFVHDYLVEHVTYNTKAMGSGFSVSHTAYGAIVKHSAVCSGYAAAYAYLLDRLGVNCLCFDGSTYNDDGTIDDDGGHTWNCAELDGKWYWVDVTWDDPLDGSGHELGGPVRHEYCFVDDSKIFESRVLDAEYDDVPACTDMTLNKKLLKADAAEH